MIFLSNRARKRCWNPRTPTPLTTSAEMLLVNTAAPWLTTRKWRPHKTWLLTVSTNTQILPSKQAAGSYTLTLVFSDLDLHLSPTGKIVKRLGESLSVTVETMASGNATVSWTKVRGDGC